MTDANERAQWKYIPCESIVITFRQTYSSIRSLTRLNINVTYVIFSTMSPTSCRNWSMVIGRPIMLVRHVCNVYMLFVTCNWRKELRITTDCPSVTDWIRYSQQNLKKKLNFCILFYLLLAWNPHSTHRHWLACADRASLDKQRWSAQEVHATYEWAVLCELRPAAQGKTVTFWSTAPTCTLCCLLSDTAFHLSLN